MGSMNPNLVFIFTSGSTESLNLAIQGALDTCQVLAQQGRINLLQLPIDTQARLDPTQLKFDPGLWRQLTDADQVALQQMTQDALNLYYDRSTTG